ncbi:MAG TPA: serine--tRNA ligase [Gemmatimonadales bacterium]|nr:serine--tRNA ligase [Gemmatimonadales bacterium]
MIDVRVLRQDPEGARSSLLRRMDPALGDSVDRVLDLDRRWRAVVTESEALRAERNAQTEEVARKKRAKVPADDLLAQLKTSADRARALDAQARELDEQLRDLLVRLPNFPHPGIPTGTAEQNRVVKSWGEPPTFDFAPRPHWELGESLGILDLGRGSKISGSGFPVFRGAGARLVRALASFMLDLHTTEHGYLEIAPPLLVSRATLTGTGQLPKFEDDLYASSRDDLFLIPTAEVPVTNLHRDEILEPGTLPVAYVAFTPCFRREAGAAGKDTRGLLRVHQFDKVELVRLSTPDASEAEHALLTGHAETVLQRLELPYRVVELASGDTSFSAARTFDLEVWAAGVESWLECSSASTFTDFQARRANLRFRPAPGAKPEFVHTLNASGVAFARTIAAILENNQAADGSVALPSVLRPYLGADRLRSS